VYAFHRYNAPLDEEFGTRSVNVVNAGKSIGVDMQGRMLQEWALDGSNFGTSEADMRTWMTKLKQYDIGWTYWAAFGGNEVRNLYVGETTIVNDRTYNTDEGVKYGGGKYFFSVMKDVYNLN
ncbi:MAG: hypothetical protein MN733_37910, partial [Nitrososphaera sp.]|nr:hypothetical protein [Nitrososphaera sp.]